MPSSCLTGSSLSILVQRIIDEISHSGPITFARFMELVLYDQDEGYYMTMGSRSSEQSEEQSRIGWTGDFYTASDVHPLLAQCLAKQIVEVDDLLGAPSQLTVIEMGPGKGLLAREILRACDGSHSDLFDRLTYRLVERSPVMKTLQEQNLKEFSQKGWSIEWAPSLEDLDEHSCDWYGFF